MSKRGEDTRRGWRKPAIITIKRQGRGEEVILSACKGDGGASYEGFQARCQWSSENCYACVDVAVS